MRFLSINVGCCSHPDRSQQLLHGPSAWFRGLFKSRAIHVTPLLWVLQRLLADKSNIYIAAFVIQPGLSFRLQGRGYSHESLCPLAQKAIPCFPASNTASTLYDSALERTVAAASLLPPNPYAIYANVFSQVPNDSQNKCCARCWNCNYSMPVY